MAHKHNPRIGYVGDRTARRRRCLRDTTPTVWRRPVRSSPAIRARGRSHRHPSPPTAPAGAAAARRTPAARYLALALNQLHDPAHRSQGSAADVDRTSLQSRRLRGGDSRLLELRAAQDDPMAGCPGRRLEQLHGGDEISVQRGSDRLMRPIPPHGAREVDDDIRPNRGHEVCSRARLG